MIKYNLANEYEKNFIAKIELAKDLKGYEYLEKFANDCLLMHTGYGLQTILCNEKMRSIIEMTDSEFLETAKQFLELKGVKQ